MKVALKLFLLALWVFAQADNSAAQNRIINNCDDAFSEIKRVTGFNFSLVGSHFRDPNSPWPNTSRPLACKEFGFRDSDSGLVKLYVELGLTRAQYQAYLRNGTFNLQNKLIENFQNFRPGSNHAMGSYYHMCAADEVGFFSHCSSVREFGVEAPLDLESYDISGLTPQVIVQFYFQFSVAGAPAATPTATISPTPSVIPSSTATPASTPSPTPTPICSGKEEYETKLGELALELAGAGCSDTPLSTFNKKRSELQKECKVKEDPSLKLGFQRARKLAGLGLNSIAAPFASKSYLNQPCDNTLLIAHFLGNFTINKRPQSADSIDTWLKGEGYNCSSSTKNEKSGKETMSGPAIHPWKLGLFKPVKEPIVIFLSKDEAARRWPSSSPFLSNQQPKTVATFVEEYLLNDAFNLHEEYLRRLQDENKRYRRTGSNRGSADESSAIMWYNRELKRSCGNENKKNCIKYSPFEVALASSQHDESSSFGGFTPYQRGITTSYQQDLSRGLFGGNLETSVVCWRGPEVKEDEECHQFNPEKKCIDEHMRKAGIRKGASGVYVPSSRFDLMAGLYAISAMEAKFSTVRPIKIKKGKEVILPSPNDIMAAICASESRFTPFLRYLVTKPKKGNSPEDSRGSCQTNLFAHKSKYVSIFGSVSDFPYYTLSNFAVSKAIYNGRGSTFQPWTEFKNGNYKAFLPRVQKRFDEYTAWKKGLDLN